MELSITITGEFLTNIVRSLFIEGDLKAAFNILEASNAPADYHIGILTGTKKITGSTENNGSLGIEEDDTKQHNGVAIDMPTSFERLKKRYINIASEYYTAKERLKYFSQLMTALGREYVSGKEYFSHFDKDSYTGVHSILLDDGGVDLSVSSKPLDKLIIKKRKDELDDLRPLITKFAKVNNVEEKDLWLQLSEQINKNIPAFNWENPLLLCNIHKNAEEDRNKKVKEYTPEKINIMMPPQENKSNSFRIIENKWTDFRWKRAMTSLDLNAVYPSDFGKDIIFEYHGKTYKTLGFRPVLYIDVSSYRGISPSAIHYYCELQTSTNRITTGVLSSEMNTPFIWGTKIEVLRFLTEEDIKDESKKMSDYRAGDYANKYFSRKDAINAAKAVANTYFPEWDIVVNEY